MAYYLVQIAYTPASLATQIRNPQSVVDRSGALIESLGGKLLCTYYAFGDYDLVQIVDMPDNVSAASLSLAAASGGAIQDFKTTVLMTVDEGVSALKNAAKATYEPPI
jgi:uncharacterized protein with GYD domain